MDAKTVVEEYFVVGGGPGPAFVGAEGRMTLRAHLARAFEREADAEAARRAAERDPTFKNLDMRVIKVRSETLLTPVR